MDVIFNCPKCDQELAVDSSGAGSEIECPSCNSTIIIPGPDNIPPRPGIQNEPGVVRLEGHPVNPIDCVEVGHDRFDEIVSNFLSKVGETNVISISSITYTNLDIGSQKLMTEFGVLIVYRG